MKLTLTLLSATTIIFSACSGSPTHQYSPTVTVTAAPLESATPDLKWSVVFEQELRAAYWDLGTHRYQFMADCPDVNFLGDLQGNLLHFAVSQDNQTALFSDESVDLLYETVGVNFDGYIILASIRPEQKTRFRFGYKDLTFEQATYAADECHVDVIIDEQESLVLTSKVQPAEFWFRGYYYKH